MTRPPRPLPHEIREAISRLDSMDDLYMSQCHSGGYGAKMRRKVLRDTRVLIEALRQQPGSPFGDAAA